MFQQIIDAIARSLVLSALFAAIPLVLLSSLIGWIDVALTGSNTSSNSLFGLMRASAAEPTGLSPVLMAASSSSADVMGKLLLQNLAVASAEVGPDAFEGTLFRKLVGWGLGLLAIVTVLIFLQSALVLGWMVP